MTTDPEKPAPPAAPPEIPAEAASAVSVAQPGRPRLEHVPRLSIAHLLLWTAATAVVLAVTTQAAKVRPVSVGAPPLDTVISSLFSGTALASLTIMLWHKLRGTLWPLEPGERLILAEGLVLVVLLFRIVFAATTKYLLVDPSFVLLTVVVMLATDAVIYGVVALFARRQARWAALLWTEALYCLSFGVCYWMMMLSGRSWWGIWIGWSTFLERIVVLVLLVTAIVIDRRRRAQRHWLHWVGAAVVVEYHVTWLFRFASAFFVLG